MAMIFRRLLVLGGARSGKSRCAQSHAEAVPGRLAYIATAQAFDAEMAERIARHRAERGPRWTTVEAPMDLPAAIAAAAGKGAGAVLVDCLTLWLSNLMLADEDLNQWRNALIDTIRRTEVPIVLVANEVGLSIVPDNALARRFRDEAGWLNQEAARACDHVLFVAAGLPLLLKGHIDRSDQETVQPDDVVSNARETLNDSPPTGPTRPAHPQKS